MTPQGFVERQVGEALPFSIKNKKFVMDKLLKLLQLADKHNAVQNRLTDVSLEFEAYEYSLEVWHKTENEPIIRFTDNSNDRQYMDEAIGILSNMLQDEEAAINHYSPMTEVVVRKFKRFNFNSKYVEQ
jgi:hypothetical protein